jgi:hypothetical protein
VQELELGLIWTLHVDSCDLMRQPKTARRRP